MIRYLSSFKTLSKSYLNLLSSTNPITVSKDIIILSHNSYGIGSKFKTSSLKRKSKSFKSFNNIKRDSVLIEERKLTRKDNQLIEDRTTNISKFRFQETFDKKKRLIEKQNQIKQEDTFKNSKDEVALKFRDIFKDSDPVKKKFQLKKIFGSTDLSLLFTNEDTIKSESYMILVVELVELGFLKYAMDLFVPLAKLDEISIANKSNNEEIRYRPYKSIINQLLTHKPENGGGVDIAYQFFMKYYPIYGKLYIKSKNFNMFLKAVIDYNEESGSKIMEFLLTQEELPSIVYLNMMILSLQRNDLNNFKYFYERSKQQDPLTNSQNSVLLTHLLKNNINCDDIIIELRDKSFQILESTNGDYNKVQIVSDYQFYKLLKKYSSESNWDMLKVVFEILSVQTPATISTVSIFYMYYCYQPYFVKKFSIVPQIFEYLQIMINSIPIERKKKVTELLVLYSLKLGYYEYALQWFTSIKSQSTKEEIEKLITFFVLYHKADSNEQTLTIFWRRYLQSISTEHYFENDTDEHNQNIDLFVNCLPLTLINNMTLHSGILNKNTNVIRKTEVFERKLDEKSNQLNVLIKSENYQAVHDFLKENFYSSGTFPMGTILIDALVLVLKSEKIELINEIPSPYSNLIEFLHLTQNNIGPLEYIHTDKFIRRVHKGNTLEDPFLFNYVITHLLKMKEYKLTEWLILKHRKVLSAESIKFVGITIIKNSKEYSKEFRQFFLENISEPFRKLNPKDNISNNIYLNYLIESNMGKEFLSHYNSMTNKDATTKHMYLLYEAKISKLTLKGWKLHFVNSLSTDYESFAFEIMMNSMETNKDIEDTIDFLLTTSHVGNLTQEALLVSLQKILPISKSKARALLLTIVKRQKLKSLLPEIIDIANTLEYDNSRQFDRIFQLKLKSGQLNSNDLVLPPVIKELFIKYFEPK